MVRVLVSQRTIFQMKNILWLIQDLSSKRVLFLVCLFNNLFLKKAVLDPENLILTDENFYEYFLVVPNIRDGDGFLIAPEDYKLKSQNISIVMVKVHFKMYDF